MIPGMTQLSEKVEELLRKADEIAEARRDQCKQCSEPHVRTISLIMSAEVT
jgi:hypothetical protein